MPIYPYGPNETLLDETEGSPPHPPNAGHIFDKIVKIILS